MESDNIFVQEIKPLFTTVITTMETYKGDQYIKGTNLIDARKSTQVVKEFQKVVAVGENVHGINVGDMVCVDPTRFGKRVHYPGKLEEATVKDNPVTEYIFDIVEINGLPHLFLQDRDIKYVVSKYTSLPVQDEKPVSIIIPPRKKFSLN